MSALADEPEDKPAVDLRATGERIEALLDASSAGGSVARERAEELVRLVVDLYGAGIERMLEVLYDTGRLDDVALDALVADDLVSSLLLVHGLHPEDVTTRVQRALDEVRPYLGTHGGDVELLGITEDGAVRLRLLGSCDGCASSAATLALAVESAIRDAAPEVVEIEVDAPPASHDASLGDTLIPVESLRVRRQSTSNTGAGQWRAATALDSIAPGGVEATVIADVAIVGCRIGGDLFAFRDSCPSCSGGLGDASLERRLGGALGDAVLRCRTCGTHYDVRRAGTSIERADVHLEPLPVLIRRGTVEVALPGPVHAGPVRA